jgi:hypothetical protein
MINSTDLKFMAYAEEFLQLVLEERAPASREEIQKVTARRPFPVPPVLISDYRALTSEERTALVRDYKTSGVAHFIVCNPFDKSSFDHPLFEICNQLSEALHLHYPLPHPLENHPEAIERFGQHDDTVKIYDLPKPVGGTQYREVAESADPFEVHLDGLGSAGTVESVILYMDAAALFGGFTFFYDMLALGLTLATVDMEAFRHLFLPDAFTAIRPRGKGAIKVVTPVFYINEGGQPQVFFRKNSGEYRMSWRGDCPALERARAFLEYHTQPFSPGSFFVPFTRKGCACISRNRDLAHGRTGFLDGKDSDQRRVLSRKWFMTSEKHSVYKHVPGISVRSDIASLSPEQFGETQLAGEWLYDQTDDQNHRIR